MVETPRLSWPRFAAIFLALSCASLRAEALLDLEKDDTLAAVFASGARVWRFGAALDRCEIGPEIVSIKFPGDVLVKDWAVKIGSFRVLADYRFIESDFTSDLMELRSAADLAKGIAENLGIERKGIDGLASRVRPRESSEPKQWKGRTIIEGIAVSLEFYPISRYNDVKGYVVLRLSWDRPVSELKFWNRQMPPPPGYESVGFAAVPPEKGPQVPSPGSEYYENLVKARKAESAAGKGAGSFAGPAQKALPPYEEEKNHPLWLPWPPLVLAIFAVIGLAVFAIWRKPHDGNGHQNQ